MSHPCKDCANYSDLSGSVIGTCLISVGPTNPDNATFCQDFEENIDHAEAQANERMWARNRWKAAQKRGEIV